MRQLLLDFCFTSCPDHIELSVTHTVYTLAVLCLVEATCGKDDYITAACLQRSNHSTNCRKILCIKASIKRRLRRRGRRSAEGGSRLVDEIQRREDTTAYMRGIVQSI
jgi:hypothetical protein